MVNALKIEFAIFKFSHVMMSLSINIFISKF